MGRRRCEVSVPLVESPVTRLRPKRPCTVNNNNIEKPSSLSGGDTPPKKSLRLMFKKFKNGDKKRSKSKNYVWPRTVEAATDPFGDATGKNKMFFMIAINLFPDSKIIQPSDTESDDEEEDQEQMYSGYQCGNGFVPQNGFVKSIYADESSPPQPQRRKRRGRRQNKRTSNARGRGDDEDLSWRTQYNRQRRNRQPRRVRIADPQVIMDVIDTVVTMYATGMHLSETDSAPSVSPPINELN